jgi:hypothetical protein
METGGAIAQLNYRLQEKRRKQIVVDQGYRS